MMGGKETTMEEALIKLKDICLTICGFPGCIITALIVTVICGIYEYLRLKRLEEEEQKKELERKRKLDMFN